MRYLSALLALSLVVVLHELGHLVCARALGLRVLRFSLGFGPPILSVRLGATDWRLGAVPLGGFAHIHGMNPHEAGLQPGDPTSYASLPVWKRALVLLSGSLANALGALALLFALYLGGTHVVVAMAVGSVEPGSEAARAGLRPGDVVLRVGGTPVHSWSAFADVVAESAGVPLTLEVLRQDVPLEVALRPRPDARGAGRIGASQQYVFRSHPPGEALGLALQHAGRLLADGAHRALRRLQGRPETEGTSPVLLTRQASDATSGGLDAFVRVLAAFSLALGCLHLLPLPALDGGRLFFLLLEKATGRRLPGSVQTLVQAAGFVALGVLVFLLAVADVRQLVGDAEEAGPAPASLPPPDGGSGAAEPSVGPEADGGAAAPGAGPAER